MTHHYPELDLILEETACQDALYRPTSFWKDTSDLLANELRQRGVERFRSGPYALNFFVPTYGTPGNGFSKTLRERLSSGCSGEGAKTELALWQFLSGETAARADHRALSAAIYGGGPAGAVFDLGAFDESDYGDPVERFNFDGKRYSRSALNYLLGLAFLQPHLGGDSIRTVLEIGGGYGTLGEIVLKCGATDTRYIGLDIPPVQFVAEQYLRAVFGDAEVTGHADLADRDELDIASLGRATTLGSWKIEKLRGTVDLFVNYISFQEMEPEVVENYLGHVDRLESRWVLLRNMREGKEKARKGQVGVKCPTLSADYLRMLPGYELVASDAHAFGYRTVDGFHSEVLLLKRRGT